MYLFGLVSNGLTALIMDWSSLLDTREAGEGNPGLHSGRHGLLVDPLLGEGNEWITASKARWRVARQRLAYGFDRCVVMATRRRILPFERSNTHHQLGVGSIHLKTCIYQIVEKHVSESITHVHRPERGKYFDCC